MIFVVNVLANPLSMLKAIIKVATPSAIPTIEIEEIKVMNLESFLERVYFFDMKKGRYIPILSKWILNKITYR